MRVGWMVLRSGQLGWGLEQVRMRMQVEYGWGERLLLWSLAAFGLVVVNGAFVYALFRPELLAEVLTNPVGLAFIAEALALVVVLAYLLAKWGLSPLSWGWFVLLSLLGSIAFALPVALLWPRRLPDSHRLFG